MRAALIRCIRKLWLRLYTTVEIDGLWVAALDDDAIPKVRDALQLIKTHDPRRYIRIGRDLGGVQVTRLYGPLGQHIRSDHTCELDAPFVERSSPEEIALVIVHEATHARLSRRGIGYDEDIRPRVEAACLRQERAFASRLPAETAERLEPYLYLDLSPSTWSDAAFNRGQLRGVIAASKELNAPLWLIGCLLRLARLNRRRRRRRALASAARREAS